MLVFESTIELPLWLAFLLAVGGLYAVMMSILMPGIQWFFRRRLNRTIEKLNARLQIKIRPFQRTKRQVLIDRLIYDSQVIEEIESQSLAQDSPREVLQARVYDYAREIVPAFNAMVYFRVGYWIARKVSRLIYRVNVSAADPDKLSEVDPQATVVFVMNHRSNIDYLLVTYLAASQVSLSYAVGEWARVFPLRPLIKALGGFFVRRNSNDPLYRKVLERYVHMSTREGVCQAVYLEGKLSRDGNIGTPKLGFLDYMFRDWDMEADRDIVFVPIGINYDHVLEDANMLAVADPTAERKSTWQHISDVVGFLKLNLFATTDEKLKRYGYASVNFGIPVSAKQFSIQNDIDFRHLDKSTRFTYVEKIAKELIEAIQLVIPVLPVPLIASVFEENPGRRLKSIDISQRVNQLIDTLMENGSPMREDEKPKQSTISQTLTLLSERGLLLRDKDHFRLNEKTIDLTRYYSNSIRYLKQRRKASR
jgi:glycerol-3-phosphate O-acyltransferase